MDGEFVWRVPPLSLPLPKASDVAAAVSESAACRLFEQRAQAVSPDFTLGAGNAAIIARLCRRLEGLPLAIELAAARIRVMSPAQIDAGLDNVFHLLVGGSRTAPARHQTLRATLDWSHDLLSERERAVFRRLGVFPGAFDLEAAEAVSAHDPVERGEVLDLLTQLLDRSLVQIRPSQDRVRYRLLATVRPYAREKLRSAGEYDTVSRAHLRHYADLVCDVEARLVGPTQKLELDRLELEGNNLRVALGFARDNGETADGIRLAANLWRLCYMRGHYREGREWLDWAAVVDPDAPPALRAKALHGGGSLAFLQCDYAAAVRRLDAGLRLYRELDDQEGTAVVVQALGSVAREQGRYERAAELHAESLRLFVGLGSRLGVAQSHGYLGFNLWLQGRWDEAEPECEQALADFRQLGDLEGIAWSLISLGTIAQYRGRLDAAEAMLAEAYRLSQAAGYPEGLAWCLHEQGLLALRRGENDAFLPLSASLARHRELGDRWRLTSVLEDLSACATSHGQAERAAALLGAADALRAEIQTELAPCERPDHERVVAQLQGWLGKEGYDAAWTRGRVGQLDDLLADVPAPAAISPVIPHEPGPAPAPAQPTNSIVTGDVPVAEPLEVQVLGADSVQLGDRILTAADWGYAKPREMFLLLVSSAPQTKEQIGAALWPTFADKQLRNAFHTALRDLRRALGDAGWVLFAGGRYTVNRERDHRFDIDVFETAINEARRCGDSPETLAHLQRAISVYQGDFLPDFLDSEWTEAKRAVLRRSFGAVLRGAGRRLAGAERHPEAVEVFRRAVAHDPLDEAAHRQLMQCLIRVGEAGRAATVYQQLAERLRDELGVAPAAETTALYRRLVRPS